jgi:hypothetical protein
MVCSRGRKWDVFYVVANPEKYRLKFGVTSGDPRPRLGKHRADGYQVVKLLLRDLPVAMASQMEEDVKATLRLAGLSPVQGKEYFDLSALGLVYETVAACKHADVAGL